MGGHQIEERKVYSAELRLQVLYYILCAAVIVLAWISLQIPSLMCSVPFVVLALWAVACVVMQSWERVILSPVGIEYIGLGWHIQADWKDVEGIIELPMGFRYLSMRSFTVKSSPFGDWWLRINGIGHTLNLNSPLGAMWSGSLVADIMHHMVTYHSKRLDRQ